MVYSVWISVVSFSASAKYLIADHRKYILICNYRRVWYIGPVVVDQDKTFHILKGSSNANHCRYHEHTNNYYSVLFTSHFYCLFSLKCLFFYISLWLSSEMLSCRCFSFFPSVFFYFPGVFCFGDGKLRNDELFMYSSYCCSYVLQFILLQLKLSYVHWTNQT